MRNLAQNNVNYGFFKLPVLGTALLFSRQYSSNSVIIIWYRYNHAQESLEQHRHSANLNLPRQYIICLFYGVSVE
jgi:hypothetical protein